MMEKPTVQNMKTPNSTRKTILARSRKKEAPREEKAPESTENPTSDEYSHRTGYSHVDMTTYTNKHK